MNIPTNSPTNVDELWSNASELDAWADIVWKSLRFLGGDAALDDIYLVAGEHPRSKVRTWWKDKVRQKLESQDVFLRLARGTWGFAEGRSDEEISFLRALRNRECPRRPRTKLPEPAA